MTTSLSSIFADRPAPEEFVEIAYAHVEKYGYDATLPLVESVLDWVDAIGDGTDDEQTEARGVAAYNQLEAVK